LRLKITNTERQNQEFYKHKATLERGPANPVTHAISFVNQRIGKVKLMSSEGELFCKEEVSRPALNLIHCNVMPIQHPLVSVELFHGDVVGAVGRGPINFDISELKHKCYIKFKV